MGSARVSGRWEGGEWTSPGEKGKSGQRGEGAPRLQPGESQHGPRRSGLPFQLRSGHASPAPQPPPPAPHSAPRRVRGNTLPRGLSEPGRQTCQHIPRTLASTPTRSPYHRLPPAPAVPRDPGMRRTSSTPPEPASPVPGYRLSRNPDIAGHPQPALAAQTGNLGTKRRQPKVRAGDGRRDGREETPSPSLKPLRQLTRRGAPGGRGAEEPGVRREEERGRGGERDRGRSGDRREGRREGEEEGKRERRRRNGDRDLGAGRGAATALSEDNGGERRGRGAEPD